MVSNKTIIKIVPLKGYKTTRSFHDRNTSHAQHNNSIFTPFPNMFFKMLHEYSLLQNEQKDWDIVINLNEFDEKNELTVTRLIFSKIHNYFTM